MPANRILIGSVLVSLVFVVWRAPSFPQAPPPPRGLAQLRAIDWDAIPAKPFARVMTADPMTSLHDRITPFQFAGDMMLSDDTRSLRIVSRDTRDRPDYEQDLLTGVVTRGERRPNGRAREVPANWASVDGRIRLRIASAPDATTRVIVVRDGIETSLPGDAGSYPLCVVPDGRFVVAVQGDYVRAWAVESLRVVSTVAVVRRETGLFTQGLTVLPSPNGRYLVVGIDRALDRFGWCGTCNASHVPHSAGSSGQFVAVWDTRTWTVSTTFDRPGHSELTWLTDTLLLSNDLNTMASHGNPRAIPVPTNGQLIYRDIAAGTDERFSPSVKSVNFHLTGRTSADGRLAVTWYNSGMSDNFRVHDLTTDRPSAFFHPGSNVSNAAFTPDGKFLIVVHTNGIASVYDLCGVTVPPADYRAERVWEDLGSPEPLVVYRATRWCFEHEAVAVPLLAKAVERRTADESRERQRSWQAVSILESIFSESSIALVEEWSSQHRPFGLSEFAKGAAGRNEKRVWFPNGGPEREMMNAVSWAMFERNYDRVIVNATRLLRLRPEHDEASLYRGYAYLMSGQREKAHADMVNAEKHATKGFQEYETLAVYYAELAEPARRDPEKALTFAKRAIEISAKWPPHRVALAKAYAANGWYDRAVLELESVLHGIPKDGDARKDWDLRFEKYRKDWERSLAEFRNKQKSN